MPTDFRLDPRLLMQEQDPIESFARGFGLVQNLQGKQLLNTQMQRQAEQAQRQQQALQQYGQDKDIQAAMRTDPRTGMALEDRQRKIMKDAVDLHDKMKSSAYGNLDFYNKEYRPSMLKAGVPAAKLPEYKTVEELNQGLYLNEQMVAKFKAMSGKPVTLHPGGAAFDPLTGRKLYEQPLKPEKTLQQIGKEAEAKWKPERFVPEKGEGPGVWIKPGEQVPQGYTSEKHKGALGSELDLSPEAIDAMARRYALDGTMPGLGLGKAATQARSKVMNRVAEIMAQEGQTPQDLKSNQIINAGLRAELTRTMAQRGPMLAFAKTADKNLDLASSLSEKVGRTGSPVINRWILAGRSKGIGDPDVASFDAAVRVAINEFAKVTSSATGGGVTSDQARKDIEGVLYSAQTPAQFKAVVATLKTDMDNRVKGYDYQINNIQESLKEVGKPGSRGGVQDKIWKPGTPTASGFQGAGRYRINGQEMVINSEEEFRQAVGQ